MSAPDSVSVAQLRDAGHDVITPAPGRQPSAAELRAVLPGIEVWIAGVEKIDAETIAAGTQLKAICRNGAGVDNIDSESAASQGIRVIPARGANARGVAELALGIVIASFRGILPAAQALREGNWERTNGRELLGATLGIVGYGAIGRTLGELASGCGMQVCAYDPFISGSDANAEIVGFEDVLRRADVVSLHLPPQKGGPLLAAKELELMREGALLVNTARSTLVDSKAVLAALGTGRLMGYAVDAFDVEPPEPDELLRHPRVIATPHLGAATRESIDRASTRAIENALAVLGGS